MLNLVTDYADAYLDLALDSEHICIAGASLGGYFALCGATDSLVKGYVSIDPFYNMQDFRTAHISPAIVRAWQTG